MTTRTTADQELSNEFTQVQTFDAGVNTDTVHFISANKDLTASATRPSFGGAGLALQSEVTSKADDSAVVHNTGNETIVGAKVFSTSVQTPVYKISANGGINFDHGNGAAVGTTSLTSSQLWGNSSFARFTMINANGPAMVVPGTSAGAVTSGNVAVYSSSGYDLTDGGAPPTLLPAKTNHTGQSADLTPQTLLVLPGTPGFYRVSIYAVITQAATTSSTLPKVRVTYTDNDANTLVVVDATSTSAANTVGTTSTGSIIFYAKQGTSITYVTSGYASSGATPMNFAVRLRLERLE